MKTVKIEAKKKRATTKSSVTDWIEDQLARDVDLRRRVDEILNEMRIEQDLAALREERGLSQSRLAKLLGVSQPAIAKLESGKFKNIGLGTLVKYTTALGARVRIEIEKNQRASKVGSLRSAKA